MDQSAQDTVRRILAEADSDLRHTLSLLERYLWFTLTRLAGSKTDFRYRWLEGRVKTPPSVIRNLEKGGLGPDDVWQINDMVGTRIVVVTRSDARILADSISGDAQCPVGSLERNELHLDTGYRALHLKGWYEMDRYRIGCEVQIRTALEDAWAVVSRVDLYERKNIPEVIARMAQIESRHLLKRLESMLRESAADTQEQVGSSSWPDLLEGTRHLLEAAHARNYEPSLIVLAGRIPFDLLSRLYQYIGPEWGLDLGPRDMRILATYRGIPVLALEEADVPALCLR